MATVSSIAMDDTLDRPGHTPATSALPAFMWDQRITRGLDVIVALVAILFFAPLMIAIALCTYAANPGPIFFAQPRIGRGGRLFRCLKFRTMATDAEARLQELLRTDPVARAGMGAGPQAAQRSAHRRHRRLPAQEQPR
ncbi:sugar transferase [Sphingomonas adhaesiva]|uniref:sugar transferase n=1 Tax=Sphingomonas adhaesiva TaxID=28212 RepID=UPI002FFB9692